MSGRSRSSAPLASHAQKTDGVAVRPIAVVDASAVLRLLLKGSPRAAAVMCDSERVAPSVLAPETANGLATQVRFGGLALAAALALFVEFRALPIVLVPDRELAPD